jgi:succinate dehydrogenase / fumarate reductase, cytochrome b subunit
MADLSIKGTPAKARPKHLDLFQIRLPLPGIVSILHRISGAGLFLMLPVLLYTFQLSLDWVNQAAFRALMAHPLTKLVAIGLSWAYLHHFCAGIRYLFLDMHKGIDLAAARASSKAVFAVSLILTALMAWFIW